MSDGGFKNLLGSRLPIIQAPMAGAQDSALTIAACKAGAIGSLPCGVLTIDQIVNDVTKIIKATDKPYNLNFFCHQMPSFDQLQHQTWQQLLQPYFNELGIDPSQQTTMAGPMPFSHDIADAIEGFQPPIISFHFGLPDDDLLQRVKSWRSKIICTATTVEEGLWLESKGVDAVIAQGIEAGGHRGMFLTNDITSQMSLLALLSQLKQQLNVPIIAAGGISSAKDIKVLLSLGATAVQIGTSYLLCTESTIRPLHRVALKTAASQHTALTNIFSGRPARSIVNRVMKDLAYMHNDAPDFPYASIEMARLANSAEKTNSDDFTPLWAGKNTSSCSEISAYYLTESLAEELDTSS